MPKEFQRENRYVVFKRSDMRKYLSQSERRQVEGLALHICLSREDDGKQPLNCLVIEKDWPEYEPTWKSIEARVTGAQPAPSTKDAIIDDLQSQFDSDGITEHDSGDALIRLSDAIAAVEDNFAGAQPAPSFADAYQGAMEEVAIWKKRALEAEDLNRKFVAEINGPTYMGEPAQPAPSEQDESVRKAWSRFSNELHRSPDAPYPGMSQAFEQHFSQSFIDREWRAEAATWAAAWKAAKRHGAQLAPSIPEGWKPIPEKHPTFDLVDLRLADGSVLCGCVPQSDGDYWWEGPSGEVFIDPRYAPVTHWRLAVAPNQEKDNGSI